MSYGTPEQTLIWLYQPGLDARAFEATLPDHQGSVCGLLALRYMVSDPVTVVCFNRNGRDDPEMVTYSGGTTDTIQDDKLSMDAISRAIRQNYYD
jgi:hypothetical protein